MAPIVRVLVASCFLFSFTLKSQNLVRNGSFELLTECPKAVSSLAKNGIDLRQCLLVNQTPLKTDDFTKRYFPSETLSLLLRFKNALLYFNGLE